MQSLKKLTKQIIIKCKNGLKKMSTEDFMKLS